MREFNYDGTRRNPIAVNDTAEWLRTIKPNVAATFTLLPARRIQNGRTGYWLHGDEQEYSWAYGKVIHALSQRYNGRAYRRYGKLIPNFAALEGDGEIKRHHIHAAFRCPERIDVADFMATVEFYARNKNPWIMGDMKIEPITGNWVGYTAKEGSEALLLANMSF